MQFVDQVINFKILIGVFIIRILQSAGYRESIVTFDMTSVHILEESESITSGWSALWDVIFLELKSLVILWLHRGAYDGCSPLQGCHDVTDARSSLEVCFHIGT